MALFRFPAPNSIDFASLSVIMPRKTRRQKRRSRLMTETERDAVLKELSSGLRVYSVLINLFQRFGWVPFLLFFLHFLSLHFNFEVNGSSLLKFSPDSTGPIKQLAINEQHYYDLYPGIFWDGAAVFSFTLFLIWLYSEKICSWPISEKKKESLMVGFFIIWLIWLPLISFVQSASVGRSVEREAAYVETLGYTRCGVMTVNYYLRTKGGFRDRTREVPVYQYDCSRVTLVAGENGDRYSHIDLEKTKGSFKRNNPALKISEMTVFSAVEEGEKVYHTESLSLNSEVVGPIVIYRKEPFREN